MPMIEGKSSQELRDRARTEWFQPLAGRYFRDPEVQSLVWTVAQFWCDEAEDAVHQEVFPSRSRAPRWPDCATEFGQEHPLSMSAFDLRRDLPWLDENLTAITAFASFCKEGCPQDMEEAEAHLPYAIARRGDGDAIEVEIVGTMLRPEWEDRFDVGFADELDDSAPAPPRSTPPASQQPARRGFFARLFGR